MQIDISPLVQGALTVAAGCIASLHSASHRLAGTQPEAAETTP